MPYLLVVRVREVTRVARRLAMTRGAAAVLTVILATTLLLGGLDYLIRLRDAGTRVLMTPKPPPWL